MGRRLRLRGANSTAFFAWQNDLLLCGPAGTGKTIALLFKLYQFGCDYAGSRMLLVRKTRAALTETGLVTWERNILGPRHPMLTRRPILTRVRQSYDFPNGSKLVVAGLDNPEKVLSSDWDFIYMLEATDFTLNDFETLSGRLRASASPVSPYLQLVCDCNPTNPSHWLFKRTHTNGDAGLPLMRLFNSKHRDNPAYWDEHSLCWTPQGLAYVETRLKNMTGARKARFYEGRWAAAEGLVFDGYDPKIHDLEPGWRPPDHWRRFWVIDWGFNVPLCLQFWALDGDNRMYLYREIYKTNMRVETLARECKRMVDAHEELRPMAVVTDHDPEAQATWRIYSGLPASNAWKEDKYDGIGTAQGRFDLAGDGRACIYFVPNCRYHPPDDILLDRGVPTGTMEELAAYVWNNEDPEKPREEPVKRNDHGCDALRYAARYVDSISTGMELSTGDESDTITGDVRNSSF